ncbi:SusD/RagB family nutrient-binding outer membrane lipoprotein [Faecalibacter sp. LW9]|uniref:SusD/RagB family nutrient-binding outer membrane lipoprotein n=1 Tax=Faecalibacter sp. LW9 TaxID=3103144 RepID=UPI002AFEDA81|nr:SusD/RagB family nutrient-binding outer membrane lipoprotein [Faecalibacter sp. LW9]
MRINKNIILSALLGTFLLSSCDNGFEEMNVDPNNPEVVPTFTIFNAATKRLMDESRDGWVSGRMVLPWVQYSAQRNYVEEDKFLYRTTTGDQAWNQVYRSIHNFKTIIDLCTNPETSGEMANYGDLQSQIGVSRIMLAYSFAELANYFGDVPYWSYSDMDNPDFQALNIDKYPQPKYVSQEVIFKNILLELKEAEAQIDADAQVFVSQSNGLNGDKIYDGDAAKWKKFANSLRLRIANQIKGVYPAAQAEIQDAIAKGVFTSNSDNAVQHYGNSTAEGSPFWAEFFGASPRNDFFINNQFVKLLKGETGSFGKDPRLKKMAAPFGTSKANVGSGNYSETDDYSKYQGMPYALPQSLLTANNSVNKLSPFSSNILKASYGEVLMEYAEVEFLLAENNGWAQANYLNGVQASLSKWGVSDSEIATYVAALPAANKENVLTQKYIALFMQPQTAWVEFRRTGYPNNTILLFPNAQTKDLNGTTYTFTSLVDGMTRMPSRIAYPLSEQTLNSSNWSEAVTTYGGQDKIDGKLWWMP